MSTPTTPEQPSKTSAEPIISPMITRCEMCEREAKDVRGLGIHIVKKHKISKADYYNKYVNTDPDTGKCLTCGASTKFYEITTGYAKFCSIKCNNTNPELARQRATKRSATLAADPSIMEKSGIAISQSFKNGPPVNIKMTIRVKHVSPKISLTISSHRCAICGQSFERSTGLSSHIKQIHPISIEEYYVAHVDPDAGKCFICGDRPRFNNLSKGYYKFCSSACKGKDPDTNARASAARAETYRKDPTIAKSAGIKRAKTFKENPHIKKQAIKKFKETLANDPSIMIASEAKRQKTLKENPEIAINAAKKRGKKLSIAMREHYNKIRQNPSVVPCTIYLVAHASLSIVKIGITTNIDKRIKEIQRDFGPVTITKIVNATYDRVTALEIEMHKRYNTSCQVQKSGGGRTEFFDKCIEASALKMLEEFESSI